jgi:outer membrane protein OmpA-like peptidoglycan-associated protein
MRRHFRGCRAHLAQTRVTHYLRAKSARLFAPLRREASIKKSVLLTLSLAVLAGCSTTEQFVDKPIYFSHSDARPYELSAPTIVSKVYEPITVYFANDSAELTPTEESRLLHFANQFATDNWKAIIITGHTDSNESEQYNLLLGQRRSEAVYSFLVASGYPLELLGTASQGELNPIALNSSSQGRQLNRRVEVLFSDQ